MTDLRIAKDRLLYMYSRLVDGKMLYKKEEAQRFGCSLRSIQRDIEDLRSFLHEQNEASGLVQDLVYNQKLGAYQLVPPSRNLLSNEEVFATLKILLESRAFTKNELYPIIDKLAHTLLYPQNRAAACERAYRQRKAALCRTAAQG